MRGAASIVELDLRDPIAARLAYFGTSFTFAGVESAFKSPNTY